jgi:hypothetical protein
MTARFVDLGDADGSVGFDATHPNSPWALVPEDGQIKLYLRGGKRSWTLHSSSPEVLTAQLGDSHGLSPNADDLEVLLCGHDDGNAVLTARDGQREMAHLRVRVATKRTVHVKFFFITDATGREPQIWSPAFAERALKRVDFLYRHQANVAVNYYGHEHIGVRDINFATPSDDDDAADTATEQIWDRLDDFREESAAQVFYNVFCVHVFGVRDVDRSVVGVNRADGNMCIVEDFISNQNHAIVVAHEMGHFLQGRGGHNDSSRHNLMHHTNGTFGGKVLHEAEIKRIRRTLD